MPTTWPHDALERIADARELRITPERDDGTRPREVPIWVVTVDGRVYVRTWHRRSSGWFGHAVDAGRARIRVPGLDATVTVEDLGDRLRADVDGAYRSKYGSDASVDRMVTDDAAATTLRLSPG